MSTDTTPVSPRPLSPRHERFVAEFLKDGNATQAYLRAGYSARGAQPSASRLLRDPRIEAAIAAGRQRLAQALEVDVTRLAQEYAKIAFASVDDFVSVGADGRLQIDLMKASQAQRAGIVELKVSTHSKQEQRVTLKLGKLQALNALVKQVGLLVPRPKPGLTAHDRERYEERCANYERALDDSIDERLRLQDELDAARAALDAARAAPDVAGPVVPEPSAPVEVPRAQPAAPPPPAQCEAPRPPIVLTGLGPPDPLEEEQQPAAPPGMPTGPRPDHRPGLYPNAKFTWSGGRDHGLGPDSAEALRAAKPGGFPGR